MAKGAQLGISNDTLEYLFTHNANYMSYFETAADYVQANQAYLQSIGGKLDAGRESELRDALRTMTIPEFREKYGNDANRYIAALTSDKDIISAIIEHEMRGLGIRIAAYDGQKKGRILDVKRAISQISDVRNQYDDLELSDEEYMKRDKRAGKVLSALWSNDATAHRLSQEFPQGTLVTLDKGRSFDLPSRKAGHRPIRVITFQFFFFLS